MISYHWAVNEIAVRWIPVYLTGVEKVKSDGWRHIHVGTTPLALHIQTIKVLNVWRVKSWLFLILKKFEYIKDIRPLVILNFTSCNACAIRLPPPTFSVNKLQPNMYQLIYNQLLFIARFHSPSLLNHVSNGRSPDRPRSDNRGPRSEPEVVTVFRSLTRKW